MNRLSILGIGSGKRRAQSDGLVDTHQRAGSIAQILVVGASLKIRQFGIGIRQIELRLPIAMRVGCHVVQMFQNAGDQQLLRAG